MLFVVDDPHAGRLYQAFFGERVDEVVVVANPDAALAVAESCSHDLAFVDLSRSVDATALFVRRLRRVRTADELYLLAATTPGEGLDTADVDEWLGRPVSLASLDEAVRRAFVEAPAPEPSNVVQFYEAVRERGLTGEHPVARRTVTQPMGRLTAAQRHIIDMQHRFSQAYVAIKRGSGT